MVHKSGHGVSGMAQVLIFCAAFVCLSLPCSSSQAQAIARPRHPDPLSRPVPLTTLRTCDPLPLLRAIQTALQADSFTITRYDEPHFVIEAEKTARDDWGPGVDRVIFWVERDVAQPMQALSTYLIYGRFEKVLGESSPSRVLVAHDYEVQRTRRIRESLVNYRPPIQACP